MKKIYLYLVSVLATAMFALSSCENDFDAKIYGSLSTINFPSTESDYENYMMGCYVPFSVNWGYNFGSASQHNFYVAEGGIMRMLDATTDECAPFMVLTWGDDWLRMTNGQFDDLKYAGRKSGGTPSHFEKVREITRFTQVIATLQQAGENVMSTTRKEELIGEARLLRGMMMYYLFHFYGPIPVVLNPSLIGNIEAESKLVRPTLDEMTEYITDDLEYAATHMVEKQSEQGRYTADYARFCLMRHYLNEGNHVSGYYQKAHDMFKLFNGAYKLFVQGDNPYAGQFKIANKFNCEVIMSVSCNSNATGSGNEGNFNPLSWYLVPVDATKYDDKGDPTPFVYQGAGWGQAFNMDARFYDTFEIGDLRAETILSSYYSKKNGWVTRQHLGNLWNGFIINKYPVETSTAFQGTDIPLARWADVLLMYAEADVRLNNVISSEAVNCVNQVRNRAGLGNLSGSTVSSVDVFLEALLMERGHELMYEGCRKVDLIRFNKYYTKMSEAGRAPSSQYFPLPNYAIQQATEAGYRLEQYFTRSDYDGLHK